MLAIDAIDNHETGQVRVLGNLPDLPGIGTDPLIGADHDHHEISCRDRTIDLADEITIARSVDELQERVLRVDTGAGEVYRMITYLLLIIVVANAGPIVHRTLPVDTAAGKKEALNKGCLAASTVTCESYIPNFIRRFRSHLFLRGLRGKG